MAQTQTQTQVKLEAKRALEELEEQLESKRKEKRLYCPLAELSGFEKCGRELCAWWIEEYEECAVKTIATFLFRLNKH